MSNQIEDNCLVRAVAWLAGETWAETVAFFDAYHEARDWFNDNGAVFEGCALALIDGRRWRPLIPKGGPFGIPSRALIIMLRGHAFAISDGEIFDTAPGYAGRNGEPFLVLVPPERKR